MIQCREASQTINLYYSVINFLEFKGLIWAGDHLPLALNSLGELHQVQVTLRDEAGKKQAGLHWERGVLRGNFPPNTVCNLSLRLEYYTPVACKHFKCDFQSIHPQKYRFAVDFPGREPDPWGDVAVRLGEAQYGPWEGEAMDVRTASDHRIQRVSRGDYCSIAVSKSESSPFAHRDFPQISFNSGPGSFKP